VKLILNNIHRHPSSLPIILLKANFFSDLILSQESAKTLIEKEWNQGFKGSMGYFSTKVQRLACRQTGKME
jgi:hypothetical protein